MITRFAALATLLLLGLVMLVFFRENPEPRPILDKAIAAHGGEKNITKPRAGLIKLKVSGHKDPDTEVTLVETFDLPKRWRKVTDVMFKGKRTVTNQLVIDGNVWEWEDPTDIRLTKDDGRAKPFFAASMVLLDLRNDKVKLSYIKKTTVNNQLAVGFRANWEGGVADYYFDSKSGLLVQTISKVRPRLNEELDQKAVWSDYKNVDGVQLAHRFVTLLKGGPFVDYTVISEFVLTEVRILDKLPDDAFAIPKKD